MLVVAVGMEKETASVGGDGWKEGGMEVHRGNDVKDDVRAHDEEVGRKERRSGGSVRLWVYRSRYCTR